MEKKLPPLRTISMSRKDGRDSRCLSQCKVLAFVLCASCISTQALPVARAADAGDSPKTTSDKPFSVRIVQDLVYRDLCPGEVASKDKNKLDLYLPRGKKNFPVVFFVHGGAWTFGDKNHFGMYSALGLSLAHEGIGVVVTNYRLSPGVRHPEHIKDVARAFAWTQKHIEENGGRPDQIFVCGHSAGGHLVALLATDESYLKSEGLNLQAIKGVIPISGVFRIFDLHFDTGLNLGSADKANPSRYMAVRSAQRFNTIFPDDAEVRKQASPISHVRAGLPPFLVIYADRDIPLLPEMAREFSSALQQKKCDVQTLEMKKRNHITVLLDATGEEDPVHQAILGFIAKHTKTP